MVTLAPPQPALLPEPQPAGPGFVRRVLARFPDRDAAAPARPPSTGTPWEIRILALLALAAYLFAGWWLRHHLHFAVGDALARTANAKYMLFARHPHFAALGFVWMPIPTVSQLPAMLIAEPLGYAADAGWVTTALWGGATVLVLGRMSRHLGVPRITGLLITLAFAFNPVIVYYAANGMSEGPLFFFIVLTFSGLLRYLRDGYTAALLVAGLGVAGCALDRYEAVPLLFVVMGAVLLADLRKFGHNRAATSTLLVGIPGVAGVTLWFLYMKVIKGSFRAFLTDASGNAQDAVPGAPTASGPVLHPLARASDFALAAQSTPAGGAPINVSNTGLDPIQYTVHFILSYAPAIVLLPLLLLAFRPLRRLWGVVALAAFAVFLPGVTTYLLMHIGSAGDPRYFVSSIAVATVVVVALAARTNISVLRFLVHPLLVVALLLGWETGVHAQVDRNATRQEQEWRVFDVAYGRVDTRDTRSIEAWASFAKRFDKILQPGDLAYDDVRYSFEAELYSTKPKQFIINNDADFDKISADPYRPGVRIDYVVTSGGRGDGIDFGQRIVGADPTAWQLIPGPGPGIIYKRLRQDSNIGPLGVG